MFKVLKVKKWFVVALAILVAISVVLGTQANLKKTSRPAPNLVIAIDAGHGGIDSGSVGVSTGKDENSLNLAYAQCLQELLKKFNVDVVMTRNNLNGLYDLFSDNKKLDDMAKRKEIVLNSNANLLLSIHMNSFPLSSCKGAQVFFKAGDTKSEILANCIQSVFVQTLPNARTTTSVGDYYMLNEFDIPCVIVECGYLSNPEEEILLITEDYKNLVCGAIFVGLIKFLSQ